MKRGRGKAGRKARQGKRTPSGQLSRAGQPKGETLAGQASAWVKGQQAKFGNHYTTALGRAYASGLLGDGNEAMNRYQAGKRFVTLYQRFIGGSVYRCPLNDDPRGNVIDLWPDYETNERQSHWLMTAMDSMDVAGVRPYFDQLISSLYTDTGPYWLDAILAGGKQPADLAVLKAAIRALDIIAPETKPVGIVSQHWLDDSGQICDSA